MATKLAIDDDLLNEAFRLGGHSNKKATINEALEEYIFRRRQMGIVNLFGKIDFHEKFDHKRARRRA